MNSQKLFQPFQFTINSQIYCFDSPIVMGILNITDDSFYDGGQYIDESQMLKQVYKMIDEGAMMIDVGAASSRPGSTIIPKDIEIERIRKALSSIRKEFPQVFISVDTYHSDLVNVASGEGAQMINDISGGLFDENMISSIEKSGLAYVLMHIQGDALSMHQNPIDSNVVEKVDFHFQNQLSKFKQIQNNDIVLDPGFGFGKSLEMNYNLLSNLEQFHHYKLPLLVGFSRKSMITKLLNIQKESALNGTSVLNTIALLKGASILRVHDVAEALESIKISNQLKINH